VVVVVVMLLVALLFLWYFPQARFVSQRQVARTRLCHHLHGVPRPR
jgi:hypothetical protein